jgi:hypothetical protein
MAQGFFQLFTSLALFVAPLALERILLHISHSGDNSVDEQASFIPISVSFAVALLFIGPVMKSIADGQNYGFHLIFVIKSFLVNNS